jgi:4-amino-4-deoxy-L-arabinose transferase-like glycosyltransferase
MAFLAGNLFWFKAILAIWSLITIFLFWKLSEAIFPKRKRAQIIATVIFALLTTIPLLEGNIINAELFMIGPTILGFLILLTQKSSVKNLLFGGFLFSVATLFKIPAAFDVPAIVVYWLISEKNLTLKTISGVAKRTLILGIGFLTPIALTLLWFLIAGALKEYLVAAFLQNVGYLSSWRPDDIQGSFLVRNGPLLMRFGIVLGGIFTFYKFRGKLSKEFIFVSSWLLFSLFAVTLSERPYPHYLIQSVGPISLLLSILFTRKTREQVLVIIPLFIAFMVPFYFKFWYYPTFTYYARFVKLATRQTTKNEYLSTFGNQVGRNYKIANFIASSTNPYEKIFVLGDGVPIYALSKRLPPGKYVADYHIKDFSSDSETVNVLTKDTPSFIVVLSNNQVFPEMENFIIKNYGLVQKVEDAEIWKLLSPQVRSLLSF